MARGLLPRPPATLRLPENRPNETDNLHKEARGRRSVAELSLDDLRRRRSLGDGRENLFPSRCAKPRPPRLSFVTIRYLFISRREENDLIYIFLVEEQETLVDLFGLERLLSRRGRGM